jgi:hypothetical protein
MPNNTGNEYLVGTVGYTGTARFPTPATSGVETTHVVELRPEISWTRDGFYTVSRRWRGHYAAVLKFSNGGSADNNGVSLTAGGAGGDGATDVVINYDDGGSLATLTVTWHSRVGEGGPGEGLPSAADVSQFSSLWTLQGSDLEKDILYCPLMTAVNGILEVLGVGQSKGFGTRISRAVELYSAKKNRDEGVIPDYFEKEFRLAGNSTTYPSTGNKVWYIKDDEPPWSSIVSYDTSYTTTYAAKLRSLADEMLKGVTGFPHSQFVLRNVKNTQWTSNVDFSNYYVDTNTMWNTKQINYMMYLDTYDSISTGLLPLIGTICTRFGSTAKWLYRTPTVQQNRNGSWTVSREWWKADSFSEVLYNDSTVTERAC